MAAAVQLIGVQMIRIFKNGLIILIINVTRVSRYLLFRKKITLKSQRIFFHFLSAVV
jgi:hypothetical protein